METIFVLIIFCTYMSLWAVKRILQKKIFGIDPEVIGKSEVPSQIFFNGASKVITLYIAVMIVLHSMNIQFYSLFSRFSLLNSFAFDISGFFTAMVGLSLCCYAQMKMGNSWRVGIDEKNHSELVTDGLYRYIRNPTYLGLFLVCIGIWLIWPTWTISLFGFTFYLFLEFQVRSEEEYLIRVHGRTYLNYLEYSKRYIPLIY